MHYVNWIEYSVPRKTSVRVNTSALRIEGQGHPTPIRTPTPPLPTYIYKEYLKWTFPHLTRSLRIGPTDNNSTDNNSDHHHRLRIQRGHKFKIFSYPIRERAKWVSGPVNGVTERSSSSEWTYTCSERPSPHFYLWLEIHPLSHGWSLRPYVHKSLRP